jgi:hypothetical protein
MATACWAFIVAKAPPPEPASTLVFSSLQGTNKHFHQQDIHKHVWTAWGQFPDVRLVIESAGKSPSRRPIIGFATLNSGELT